MRRYYLFMRWVLRRLGVRNVYITVYYHNEDGVKFWVVSYFATREDVYSAIAEAVTNGLIPQGKMVPGPGALDGLL